MSFFPKNFVLAMVCVLVTGGSSVLAREAPEGHPVSPEPLVSEQALHRMPLTCEGVWREGGFGICTTAPGAVVELIPLKEMPEKDLTPDMVAAQRLTLQADDEGIFVIAFHRDAAPFSRLRILTGPGQDEEGAVLDIQISDRTYKIERIDGLPPSKVTPQTPEQIKHIKRDRGLKKKAFASRAEGRWFLEDFKRPAQGRLSGFYGSQRILNGTPKNPHYGVDIAAPKGTPVHAPAGGVVILARPDMYYEGGLVLLDHGQGFVSTFMHMSAVDVKEGTMLQQGDPVGKIGATGRATGPHLDWRMTWRGVVLTLPPF